MSSIYLDVADQLLQLEAELRRLDLWQAESPSAEDLASSQPFCVDTLTLPQWLQFIFIPRMAQLVEAGGPLPQKCGTAPIAEEFFRERNDGGRLIALLGEIDARLERG
ncbi:MULTISPECIES: YqcC family protein [Microbulbifer]|uniref:YqcC family protein n=1 Tax=Microbulbifer TaxID=48073 RepID=UPI001E460F99|nr:MULTISPECIES: YqcC family protein [Microbulbifer]UHQ56361.1 YqcC family protein [Microbulbifer sp. YPW16]